MRRGGRLTLLLGLMLAVVMAMITFFFLRGEAVNSVVPNGSFQLQPGQTATAHVGTLRFALRNDSMNGLSVTSPACRVDDSAEPAPVVCGNGIIVFRIENYNAFRRGRPVIVRNQGYVTYLSTQ